MSRPRQYAEGTIFSHRELAVVRAMLQGLKPREIAKALGISGRAVIEYRRRAAEKLHVSCAAKELPALIAAAKKYLDLFTTNSIVAGQG